MPTIEYTVRPGDTVWKLAQRYNTTVNDIARYNGLSDPNEIFVDQKLRIFVDDNSRPEWYTVQTGDSLYQIAEKFGTTVDNLVALNHISNPDKIYPGRVLRLRP